MSRALQAASCVAAGGTAGRGLELEVVLAGSHALNELGGVEGGGVAHVVFGAAGRCSRIGGARDPSYRTRPPRQAAR